MPALAAGVTRPDQKDVAGADADSLLPLGSLEVRGKHVLSGLQPPDIAQASDVE
jgi:hypothetical protein